MHDILILLLTRAYSIAVERVHGMDEVGVRLPVGPFDKVYVFTL